MNEQQLIARVEQADTREFADILAGLNSRETQALRTYFGAERFERLAELAHQTPVTRGDGDFKGNVAVIHGIMGSELSEAETDAKFGRLWANPWHLVRGAFMRFDLDGSGKSVNRISATGILKRYYGEQLLFISREWNTHAFWFDWRLSLERSAEILDLRLREWFGDEPVHLVAHSMGGLVARMFIAKYPERWKRGGRLIMLGTPNHGSPAAVQVLTGMNDTIRKLALLDIRHKLAQLLSVAKTFSGVYQMLPSPLVKSAFRVEPLYQTATYGDVMPPQVLFDRAMESHQTLASVVDPTRMFYIAGYDKPTYDEVSDITRIGSADGYTATRRGDGTVPHRLGLLDGVPVFYIQEEHGALPNNDAVCQASLDLLETGGCGLPTAIPDEVRGLDDTAKTELARRTKGEVEQMRLASTALKAAASLRGNEADEPQIVTEDSMQLQDLLLSGFVGEARSGAGTPPPTSAQPGPQAASAPKARPKIEIRVVCAGIEKVGEPNVDGNVPVDAVAVGHYLGVKPISAESMLDEAISGSNHLLTKLTERGVIRGDLGQFFLLEDPRPRDTRGGRDRLLVIAGMGPLGRCGMTELTGLTRELWWTLGSLGKQHLASVLIGSGAGNMVIRDALRAWIDGIGQAAAARSAQGEPSPVRLSFIEFDPARALRIQARLKEMPSDELDLAIVDAFSDQEQDALREEAAKRALETFQKDLKRKENDDPEESITGVPTRLSVELTGTTYRFGAMTETASIPQRDIPLDPDLVNEANDELVRNPGKKAEEAKNRQLELGGYLQQLLIPEALEEQLATRNPLIIICDATSARVHWEMVAQPSVIGKERGFLGLCRGLTRQLRTTFASLPDLGPADSQTLRILIIGDPAADKPLAGARAEAERVRNLFMQYQQSEAERQDGRRVEIVALLGPGEATRNRVMQELILRRYDILHYAGHCVFDKANPQASGWIFSEGKRLSANELDRVRRMPPFVFSNACESGLTPDRSDLRSAALGPSFAEAFFKRDVRNFICTGWPVGDKAALKFADRFYSGILGLGPGGEAESLHVAMREGRKAIQAEDFGIHTWGAYQHYGDPYWRAVVASRSRRA